MALNQFKATNRIELVVRAGVCSEPARCGASGTETAPLGAKAGAGRPRQPSIGNHLTRSQLQTSQCRRQCPLSQRSQEKLRAGKDKPEFLE